MRIRIVLAAVALCLSPLAVRPAFVAPQAGSGGSIQASASSERAIRRDIPLTNQIRRAFDAGTRDKTGRPGANYWQTDVDYTIQVSLDPSTQTLTGTETLLLHNNSPMAMTEIGLRLDHNIFRPTVPRASPSVPAENTDGMVLTKLVVNGEAVNLTAPAAGGGRRGGGGAGAGGGGGAAAPRPTSISERPSRLSPRRLSTSPGTRNCLVAPPAAAIV
jgi:hypothetical protein